MTNREYYELLLRSKDGIITVTVFGKNGGKQISRCSSAEEIEEVVSAHLEGYNTYIDPNLRRTDLPSGLRGGDEDVTVVNCLTADVDIRGPAHTEQKLPETTGDEWADRTADDYYALGQHTVRVRARDSFGDVSDWAEVDFEITNEAPERPVISRLPADGFVMPGTPVTITASAVDPDGDAVTYIWDNRPEETYVYPDGRQVVRVKAVDAFGAESSRNGLMFIVGDPNRGGGMVLIGPNSYLEEPGIEEATLIRYTFTVPPVDGHSGNDYGRVRGYNRITGQWDELDYGTTSNGIF